MVTLVADKLETVVITDYIWSHVAETEDPCTVHFCMIGCFNLRVVTLVADKLETVVIGLLKG